MASEEFDAFLTQFPGHKMADLVRFFRGEALVQQGQYAEARKRFAEFLEAQPNHQHAPQAHFRLAEAAHLLGEAETARQAFKDFRARHPGHDLNQFVLPYLGDLAMARQDAAAAQTLYAEALEKYPQSTLRDSCRLGLARALESLGDLAGAERFYRFVAEQNQGDLADDGRLRLGLLLYGQRRYEPAAQEFRRLESDHPESEHVAAALYWQGRSHFALQNWEGAIATLAKAPVLRDPQLAPGAAFTTGEALARLGRTQEASARLSEVADKWPQSEWADDALQTRIDLALAAGDAETVSALATDFAQRFPQSDLLPAVQLAHGRSLLHRQKHAEAAALFEQLIAQAAEKSTDRPAQNRGDVHRYYLGLARIGAGDFDAALAALQPIRLDGDNPELAAGVRVARAAALLGLERFEEATPLLREYLQAQPNGPDAPKCRAQLVLALTRLGRLEEAAEAHAELAQKHPEHPHFLPATEFLAETAYAAGDKELARRMFTLLAREGNPQQFAAKGLSGLAWLEFESDDPEQSAAAFERLLQAHPDSKLAAEAAMMQAKSQERLGKHDGAATMYRLVLAKYAQSAQAPAAMLALARLLTRQGQHAEAATLYERRVKEFPAAANQDAALYQWAWALVDTNQPEAADAVFTTLVNEHRQSPYWADAAYRLAERATQAKNYQEARRLAEDLLASSPTGEVLAHALYLQGQIAASEERWADVAAPMDRVAREFPESSLKLPAMYWAAESYYRQHQYEEAGRRFTELAPLAETGGDSWLAMVPLRQAQVLAHRKQWSEAHELASTIAARFPEFRQQYEADYLLGRCLMAQARFQDARVAFEQTIRSTTGGRTETAAMAQWMIGETFFHQKNYLEAIKAYHRVEQLFPFPRWQAGALLQSGKCHEMQGDFRQAVTLYAQLLKDFPDTPFAEEASQRLRVAQKRAALTP